MKFLLDNHVYDVLVETPERAHLVAALHGTHEIELLMTHIQVEEISANPRTLVDAIGQLELRVADVVLGLPYTVCETYGMVLDVSQVGLARFGEPDLLDAVDSERGNHTHDALLASTARYENAVLVTNDRRLTNRAPSIGVKVWSVERFVAYVDRHAEHEPWATVVANARVARAWPI